MDAGYTQHYSHQPYQLRHFLVCAYHSGFDYAMQCKINERLQLDSLTVLMLA